MLQLISTQFNYAHFDQLSAGTSTSSAKEIQSLQAVQAAQVIQIILSSFYSLIVISIYFVKIVL
ncbi:MAG: hypothetical protein ACI83B_001191, partial [Sediminicola sp.]